MFRHIVVPVDGSKLAEAVFPFVRVFAKAFGARITLLQALDIKGGLLLGHLFTKAKASEIEERAISQAEEYLKRLATTLPGVVVNQVVAIKDPEAAIAEEAECSKEPTLIAMSTHGRSGIGRWIIGSVTDKVAHAAPCSMLVVRPSEEISETEGEAYLSRIIVPLDGSERAQQALPTAEELGRLLGLEMILIRVFSAAQVARAQLGMVGEWPIGDSDVLQEVEDEARKYLEDKANEIRDRGVERVKLQFLRGDPAGQIVDQAHTQPGNLVVMSSRGRTGLGRTFLGSVSNQVVRTSGTPVLLVRS